MKEYEMFKAQQRWTMFGEFVLVSLSVLFLVDMISGILFPRCASLIGFAMGTTGFLIFDWDRRVRFRMWKKEHNAEV